jgi:phospholipid:diacylglycerol acyltransferase
MENATSPLVALTDSPPDDFRHSANKSLSNLDRNLTSTLEKFITRQEHNTEDLINFLQEYGSGVGPDNAASRFVSQFGNENNLSRSWYDVTRQPLPYAPKMKIFCLYGTGLPTERAYYYKRNWEDLDGERSASNILEPFAIINTTMTNEERNVSYGIKYSDGDGSVPLVSLGYMCADAWQREDSGLNPSNIQVFTREYKHRSEFRVDDPMRGGPGSSDHVDILGNVEMMEDFLKIVTDFKAEDVEQDRIVSDIKEISKLINKHPNGGLFRKRRNVLSWHGVSR